MMLVLARGRFGSAPARVLAQVRRRGQADRDEIASATGLSPATVARTTTALVEADLLRERGDLAHSGAVGRPSIPLEVDPGRHSVLGVHVGRRVTTVGLVGLDGRVVAESRWRTEGSAAELAAAAVARGAALAADSDERTVLAVGLTGPWTEVGYDAAELADHLASGTGLEVSTAHHVAAVAAAEFLGRRRVDAGCTAYVYVRDTAGFVLANDLDDRTEISRVSTLAHFPTRTAHECDCGQVGCLLAAVSDEAVALRAADAGLVARAEIGLVLRAARAGDAAVVRMLRDRAEVLGSTVAVLRDMIGPDRMVLVGQAFTGYPGVLRDLVAAYESTTTLGPLTLSVTRFGTGVQAAAAGAVALGPVFEDPLGAVERGTTRRTTHRPPAPTSEPALDSLSGPAPLTTTPSPGEDVCAMTC